MCTGHDDTAGREEVARLSRRGFLRTTVTTAAVVGTSGALAGPAFAQQEASGQGRGRHRVPPDQISIQLYTLRDQLGIDRDGTLAALGEIGYTRSSTPASSAAPSRSSRRPWTPPGSGQARATSSSPSPSTRPPGAPRWPTPPPSGPVSS